MIARVIRATDVAQLADMPARWLRRNTLAENFLRRWGRDREHGISGPERRRPCGDGFGDRRRQRLLYRILCLGMGKAIPPTLLRGTGFTSPSKQIDMIYRFCCAMKPCRHFHRRAIRTSGKITQGGGAGLVYAPPRRIRVVGLVAPQLAELLDLKDGGSSTLAWADACQGRRAPAVDAFFVLLENILTDSAAQWHMKDALSRVLLTADSLHAPASSFAMAMGHAPVVRAFYAGIKDLLIGPGPGRADTFALAGSAAWRC